MLKTLQNQVSQVPSELTYRVTRAKYARNLPKLAPCDQSIVDALNSEGVFVTSLEKLAFTATTQLLKAAKSLLPSRAVNSTNRVKEENINGQAIQVRPGQFVTLTDYPDFFLWGLEERLLNIVESYIGLPVAYQGVNFRQDFATDKPGDTQQWHRDGEDRRIVKVIIYLSDVGLNNGPFEYIPKPLTPSYLSFRRIYHKVLTLGFSGLTYEQLRCISNEELKLVVPEAAWKACLGSVGTVIFVDTRSVLHRGKPPKAERSTLYYIYTSRNPRRPDICKANFDFDGKRLTVLAKTLPQRQRECIFWEQSIS
jgi:hypothetical protein